MAFTDSSLEVVLSKHREGAVIMIEAPAEGYFEANSQTLKHLIQDGFRGVYVSFQRPFANLASSLGENGVDISKVAVIDAAAACAGVSAGAIPLCTPVSSEIDIDELIRAIYTSLEKIPGRKKFIFIDSLTTVALYKPLSEVMRFSQFLISTVRRREVQDVFVVFGVAQDLANKPFIRDVALQVDDVVSSG